jgi:hypothetical protein
MAIITKPDLKRVASALAVCPSNSSADAVETPGGRLPPNFLGYFRLREGSYTIKPAQFAYGHKLNFPLKIPWPKSARELYRPSYHRLSAKLVPTFADRGCHVVSVTDPYVCILGFLDLNGISHRVHKTCNRFCCNSRWEIFTNPYFFVLICK